MLRLFNTLFIEKNVRAIEKKTLKILVFYIKSFNTFTNILVLPNAIVLFNIIGIAFQVFCSERNQIYCLIVILIHKEE